MDNKLIFYHKDLNHIFVILVLLFVRCNKLAEPIAMIRAKTHNVRMHWCRVDGNLITALFQTLGSMHLIQFCVLL